MTPRTPTTTEQPMQPNEQAQTYFVTYYVTLEVEAASDRAAKAVGERALIVALKDGTIGDYISEDGSVEAA
jgi:hypothetical protein